MHLSLRSRLWGPWSKDEFDPMAVVRESQKDDERQLPGTEEAD